MSILDLIELDQQPEESFSFRTYKNYLQSLSGFVTERYGSSPGCFSRLKAQCTQQGIFSGVQATTVNSQTKEDIKKLLFNAWNTELVLALPAAISPDFIKYANHWSPVQAYYAVYLSLQAYFRSCGLQAPPRDHTASLNTISARVCEQNVFPPFWSVCCEGEPSLADAQYRHIPGGIVVKEINPLTTPTPEDVWDWYAMLLRTTRERQLRKRLKESGKQFPTKKGKPRKHFTPEQKRVILAGLRPTTVFDFLYRLRIRSNYEDADTFILGTMGQTDAREFNEALRLVTASTLYLLELHIAMRLGVQEIGQFIEDFTSADKKGFAQSTIGTRKPFLV